MDPGSARSRRTAASEGRASAAGGEAASSAQRSKLHLRIISSIAPCAISLVEKLRPVTAGAGLEALCPRLSSADRAGARAAAAGCLLWAAGRLRPRLFVYGRGGCAHPRLLGRGERGRRCFLGPPAAPAATLPVPPKAAGTPSPGSLCGLVLSAEALSPPGDPGVKCPFSPPF